MARPIPTASDMPMHGWYPYDRVHRERLTAHAKHDDKGGSMERKDWDDPAWLAVLVEEVGEVARALCDMRHLADEPSQLKRQLASELVQVAAMACAWLEAVEAPNV